MSASILKMTSMNVMLGLFFLLVTVVYVDPSIIRKLNSTILGRLIIVIILIYFSVQNPIAGLLAALIIISIMQMYFVQEGMDNMSEDEMKISSLPSLNTPTIHVISNDGTSTNVSNDSSTGDNVTGDKISSLKAKVNELKTSGSIENSPDQLSVDPTRTKKDSNTMSIISSKQTSTDSTDDVEPSTIESFCSSSSAF
jgi:hypothetical protein